MESENIFGIKFGHLVERQRALADFTIRNLRSKQKKHKQKNNKTEIV